jgi:two-component system sensor histidine kinase HydH
MDASFEEIHRDVVHQFSRRLLAVRTVIAPLVLVLFVWIALRDPAPWRHYTLAVAFVAMPILTAWEKRRIKRASYTASLNILSMSSLLLLLSTSTGALESPFLLHLTVAWVMGAFLIPRRLSGAIATLAVTWMWTMAFLSLRPGALLPRVFLEGPPDHPRIYYFFCATLQTVNVLACRQLGVALRGIVEEMVGRSFANRDETLRAHAERTTELVTLSGQIAHELEQPLANLESLAAVIEAEAEPARAAAQLAALQAEVARMQAILEEFLNFSRPLVPLTIGPVDLQEIVSDVGYLHEGLAAERHVALQLPADAPLEVRCDARKVKQILVNLMQNALSVSPAGSAIVVELARAGGGDGGAGQATLRVSDRGSGVPAPAATERGLGYTIVRALAEQHGGSFHVEPRAGGGCVAELLLPIEGPAARV